MNHPEQRTIHFWWTDTGYQRCLELDKYRSFNAWPKLAKIGDEIVPYVFANAKMEPPTKDQDLLYLGEGRIYSIGGIQQ